MRNVLRTTIVTLALLPFTVGCSPASIRREWTGLGLTAHHLRAAGSGNVYTETIGHLRGGQDFIGGLAHFTGGRGGLNEATQGLLFFVEPFDLKGLAMTWSLIAQ